MTGTALTEAEEFANIYDLGVTVMPTNRPITRTDEKDSVIQKPYVENLELLYKKSKKLMKQDSQF